MALNDSTVWEVSKLINWLEIAELDRLTDGNKELSKPRTEKHKKDIDPWLRTSILTLCIVKIDELENRWIGS